MRQYKPQPADERRIAKLAPHEYDDLVRQVRIVGPTLTSLRTGQPVSMLRILLQQANKETQS